MNEFLCIPSSVRRALASNQLSGSLPSFLGALTGLLSLFVVCELVGRCIDLRRTIAVFAYGFPEYTFF